MTIHLNPLDILLESQQPDNPPPDFRWGLIHGTSPDLSVRLDRDPTTVIGSCCSLTYPLEAGDRVMVMVYDGRAVVFGRGGGDRPPTAPVWQSWSPTLLASVNPVMGNSERIGRYRVSEDGSVDFTAKITFGSTFNANGSGAWSMTLPVPPNISGGLEWKASLYVVSSAVLSGGGEGEGYGKIEDGTVTRMFVRRNDPTASNPQRLEGSAGFVRGNKIVVTGTYEAA